MGFAFMVKPNSVVIGKVPSSRSERLKAWRKTITGPLFGGHLDFSVS